MKKNDLLVSWEWYTNELAEYFAIKYFGKATEHWWIADDKGGVYCINDYFFDLKDMVDFIRYHYSVEKMFEYYEYSLNYYENRKDDTLPINIETYKKLNNYKKNAKNNKMGNRSNKR